MLSIIAPAYNNTGEVKALLESIARYGDVDFPYEAIIVDDGSTDDAMKGVVEAFGFARYERMPANKGAAVARNHGARIARYDRLMFVDSDIVFLKDTLQNVGRDFLRSGHKAFVGRFDFEPVNKGFFPRYKTIMFNSWLPNEDHSTVFSPAIGGVDKATFLKSGGFDEAIRGATVEWVRFSYELTRLCRIAYFPDVVVGVKINSFGKALYTDFYSTMKWVTIYKHYMKERPLDNHCMSGSVAVGRILGCLSLGMLPLCFNSYVLMIWLAVFCVYLYVNRGFFLLVRRRESPFFLARSVAAHMIFSSMTVAGGVAGLVMVFRERLHAHSTVQ
ncbi:MAG: glycosyltransferase family 2 protein [Candidatus Omnitrophica bacterium]|nr:glycosyltransferase family 2 protein [Candidatus Omnitrophota bacterium]